MLKNYFKIAFRGYLRNGKFTALNLLSLVIGLFVAYVGISYLLFETGYERFHQNSDRIYRVAWSYRSQDYSVVGFPSSVETGEDQLRHAEAIASTPGVEGAIQFITSPYPEFIQAGDSKIQQEGILTTNTAKSFSQIFSWQPILGSLDNFGSGVRKVMLTESVATKLFGPEFKIDSQLIGSTLKVGSEDYELAAVIRDVPVNSHFDFKIALNSEQINYWGSRIYILAEPEVNASVLTSQINQTFAKINPRMAQDELYRGHFLQPIRDIHLHSSLLYESKSPGNTDYLLLIGFFSAFILIITLFNYTNLTLAIKSKESKMIGVRKAMGAQNSMIVSQFLMDAIVLSLMAVPLVGILVSLLVPRFNSLMGTDLADNLLLDPKNFMLLVGMAVFLGLAASIAPSIYLSLRKTVSLFKEDSKQVSFQQFPVRKYLVISQFVILIAISCVSVFISSQLRFVAEKDLGYRKDGILFAYTSPEKLGYFQEKIRQIPGVLSVGNGSSLGIETFNQGTYRLENSDQVFDDSNQLYFDFEALKAYGIQVTQGKLEGSRMTLINRTAAERFATLQGISTEELIGRQVITEPEYVNEETGEAGIPFTIGGIVEDIHLFSLREKVGPYFLSISDSLVMDGRSIVAFEPENSAAVMRSIAEIYAGMDEEFPLELEFMSDNLSQLYAQESQLSELLSYFNLVAVCLAGLGIIGITLFMTISRKKEIGIRKVLGASVLSIIQLATKEYLIMVGVAFLVAIPISYYTIQSWLDNFAYRIGINPLVFVGVGLLTLVFTAALVSFISYHAANANPVNSLKEE
ncbi:ABC transporter permease [Algoriphagus litoralis]|uniref:ABC transporter permease n=1 Tax=Algoriphagus litoralis TaxID=2202829 RepID=UPI000DBA35D3|nr:ABC transporter permease [Algoriphagus litoralis]